MQLINFSPNFNVKILDSERVILFSEDQHYLLQGSIYVAIAEILNSKPMCEKDIADNLSSNFSYEGIHKALNRLKRKSFIKNFYADIPKNISAFWSDLSLENKVRPTQSIGIKNFSLQNTAELIKAINSLSLKIVESGDFFIVVVDNYICDELNDFNKARLKDGKPWLLLKPSGRIIWLGPIFEPRSTGCWNCLAEKLKENRRVEIDIFGLKDGNLNIPSLCYLPTTVNIAMNMAANEAAKWEKSTQSHRLYNSLMTIDLGNLEMRLHSFKPLKNCRSCQTVKGGRKQQLPILKCSLKTYFEDGERSCTLDETLENIKEMVSPLTGIISSIRHLVVNGEHICYGVRTLPLPAEHDSHNQFIRLPDIATGKGKTKLQATIGCIAEAIERYNCTFSIQNEIRSNYKEIKDIAIHPHELMNFSEAQYANREKINEQRVGFNKIAKRYDESEIGWTAVYSMTHLRFRYVPSSYCYLYYPFEKDVEMCPGNSNGCASGNSLEEAIFYAILELVERDAVAIWWYNRIQRPCVDLSYFKGTTIDKILVKFKKEQRKLYVLELTTDLGIPCYAAVSWKSDGSQIFFGTSAHLQPHIGITRAISELNQIMIRANMPKDIDLDSISPNERDLVKWSINEMIENHSYLVPSGVCKPTFRYPISDNFLSDINKCLEILKNLGLDVLLFDLTNPNIKFHTVRIIIPGLRHFWSRLAPGRLYETPVHLGWLKKPLQESEMNQIPYFL